MFTNKQLLKLMCELCQNDAQTCKYSCVVKEGKICKYFTSNYTCSACKSQCLEEELCYNFVPKDLVTESNKSHPIEEFVQDLLMELMRVEKFTHNAILVFKQKLESSGIKASLTSEKALTNYIDSLIALFVLSKLIEGYGLDKYKDRIINNEVDRIFATNVVKKSVKKEPQ